MKWAHRFGALVLASAVCSAAPARAESGCDGALARAEVVLCALRASPAVYAEEKTRDAAIGRARSASVWLPSNPVLGGTLGASTVPGEDDVHWSASLAQEIAIGGQRGARMDVAQVERTAQDARILAVKREVAAGALDAYFDALAAREERALAERVVDLATALTVLARARVESGLSPAVDIDVADAAATRLFQARFAAERRVAATSAALLALLGRDPAGAPIELRGDLAPIAVPAADPASLAAGAIERRAEIGVIEAERRIQERRTALLERSRIPNLTLTVFAENDRVNRRVVGLGLSVPIPLPAPVGHTNAGAIDESRALGERAGAEMERARRAIRVEVVTAAQIHSLRVREAALFDPAKLARAEAAIGAITRELEARRLSVRDALVSQQSLIELLQGGVEARRRLCLASVDLVRAAGLPLEGLAR